MTSHPALAARAATEPAADEVLEAFESARAAGRPVVDCYRAGVDVWRRHHPDQAPEYAAKRAVALILARHVVLKVGD